MKAKGGIPRSHTDRDDAVLDIRKPPRSFTEIPPEVQEPEWEYAIDNRFVSIHVLADAFFRGLESSSESIDALYGVLASNLSAPLPPPDELRRLSDRYLKKVAGLYFVELLKVFHKRHGKIVRVTRVFKPIPCYAVLTRSGEIFVSGNLLGHTTVLTAEERNVYLDCLLLSREVKRVVRFPQGRQACGDAIFSVITTLLNSLSERRVNDDLASFVKSRYRAARALCEQFGRRDAQCVFLYAMIAFTIIGGAAFYFYVQDYWVPRAGYDEAVNPANCAFAGTVGAAISVLIRVTRGKFDVSYQVGQVLLMLSGMFRSIIGLVFGFLVYAFIQGNLTPFITVPADGDKHYFFIAVGFLAGFSERLIPQLLASTEGGLGGGHPPSDASTESAMLLESRRHRIRRKAAQREKNGHHPADREPGDQTGSRQGNAGRDPAGNGA
jgi:hypothetical protein